MNNQEKPIKIIQISDTHLFREPDGVLAGLNTQKTFDAVVEVLKNEHMPADLILATGDIVHNDDSETGYLRFKSQISELNTPTLVIPGNHDKSNVLKSTLNSGLVSYTQRFTLGNWQIIMLDSSVWGSVHGHLSEDQLQLLESSLSSHQDLWSLVVLHHHPVPVNCRWIDPIGLDNSPALWKITDAHPNVKAVIWGHIHQDFVSERNGVHLMSTPSTCIQFKPRQDEFGLDHLAPGFRKFSLYNDGKLTTEVVRINELSEDIDYSTSGYE